MLTNSYTFQQDAGREVVDGKPHWPDMIEVEILPGRAYDLISSIAVQLRDGAPVISLIMLGKLSAQAEE